jgi:hypothetical protein
LLDQPAGLGLLSQPAQPDAQGLLAQAAAQYPRLGPMLNNFAIQWGNDPKDGRQLEFYPPWESDNPNPGKSTLELYNRDLQGPWASAAAAGDALHLMGTVDPRTNQQIDPNWMAMKQQLLAARTPRHEEMDRQAYQQEAPMYGGNLPSYDQWMQNNRGDAYIRGYLTPAQDDEWRKSGVYTPQMTDVLERMRSYLQRAPNDAAGGFGR